MTTKTDTAALTIRVVFANGEQVTGTVDVDVGREFDISDLFLCIQNLINASDISADPVRWFVDGAFVPVDHGQLIRITDRGVSGPLAAALTNGHPKGCAPALDGGAALKQFAKGKALTLHLDFVGDELVGSRAEPMQTDTTGRLKDLPGNVAEQGKPVLLACITPGVHYIP